MPYLRAALLWIALGVVTLVCGELWERKFIVERQRKMYRLGVGERFMMMLIWPLMIAFWVEAGRQVRRDMRAMHGDDPGKWPKPDDPRPDD